MNFSVCDMEKFVLVEICMTVIFDSEQLPHTRSVSCAYNGSCKNVFLANLCCKNVHGISETLLLGYKFYFLLVP